jgi:hypothetical protein
LTDFGERRLGLRVVPERLKAQPEKNFPTFAEIHKLAEAAAR